MRHALATSLLLTFATACAPEALSPPPDAAAPDASARVDAATLDLAAPVDVPASADVQVSIDVPVPVDVPAATPDVPVPVDVPVATPDVPVPVDVPAATPDVPVPVDVPVVTDGPSAAQVEALVGTWATRMRGATVQTAPIIGMVRTSSTAYGIAVVARVPGGGLSITERACRVAFDRSTLGQTSIEDRAVQSVAAGTSPLRFARVGAAWRWQRAARTVAVGWRPTTSPDETLPTARTDVRVFDADGDGNPGVSVRIQSLIVNGSVYVVQAQRGALDGDWDAANAPRAVNDPTGSTQRTVGASTRTLEQDIPSSVDASAAANGVTLARLPAGSDCAALITALPTLFR